MSDYAQARRNMIDCQLRPAGVSDARLLAAMGDVPRERFVPRAHRGVAYVDEDLPIASGRCLMEPAVLARLIQAAAVGADDVALVVGSGSGYAAVVLARLASTVVALECDPALAESAEAVVSELVDNVVMAVGPLPSGAPAYGPFDVILLDGAAAELPEALIDQLNDGGRLVGVLAPPGQVGRAIVTTRLGGLPCRRDLFDAAVAPLPGFAPTPAFQF